LYSHGGEVKQNPMTGVATLLSVYMSFICLFLIIIVLFF